jgi:hypothetical protein
MDVTFLCQIRLPNETGSTLPGVAEDIADELINAGYEILSVRPWAREGVSSPDALASTPPPPVDGLFL